MAGCPNPTPDQHTERPSMLSFLRLICAKMHLGLKQTTGLSTENCCKCEGHAGSVVAACLLTQGRQERCMLQG